MSTQSITAPPHTRAARHSYPIEMALFTEELSCGQLLAALVATGHTPPLLTLDDVIFIKRRCTRLVRSCSLDTRYGCILVEETCIIAQAPPLHWRPGDITTTVEQIGAAAAYAALLEVNKRRFRRRLALVRLRQLAQRRCRADICKNSTLII